MKIDWEKVAPISGQLADALTTHKALRVPGAYEANPLMRATVDSPGTFLALKVGMGLGVAVAVNSLQKRGKKKTARIVSILGTVLGAGPAINNLIASRKR